MGIFIVSCYTVEYLSVKNIICVCKCQWILLFIHMITYDQNMIWRKKIVFERWLNNIRINSITVFTSCSKLVTPVRASLGHLLGKMFRSWRGTTTPSMLPNIVESPKQKSMIKNNTAHRGEMGILVMASVNTMKARPVPSTPWWNTRVTWSYP